MVKNKIVSNYLIKNYCYGIKKNCPCKKPLPIILYKYRNCCLLYYMQWLKIVCIKIVAYYIISNG